MSRSLALLFLSSCLSRPVVHAVSVPRDLREITACRPRSDGNHCVNAVLSVTNDNDWPLVVEVHSATLELDPANVLLRNDGQVNVVVPSAIERARGPIAVPVTLEFRSSGTADDLRLLDALTRELDAGRLRIRLVGRAFLASHQESFEQVLNLTAPN